MNKFMPQSLKSEKKESPQESSGLLSSHYEEMSEGEDEDNAEETSFLPSSSSDYDGGNKGSEGVELQMQSLSSMTQSPNSQEDSDTASLLR